MKSRGKSRNQYSKRQWIYQELWKVKHFMFGMLHPYWMYFFD